MHCPTCAQACAHPYDPLQGAHVADHCACGQLLPWDSPVTSPKPSASIIGVPALCAHPDQGQSGALFPLTRRCSQQATDS